MLADIVSKAKRRTVGGSKPPPGYQPIPGGKKGGYRKRVGKDWVYWYPDKSGGAQLDLFAPRAEPKKKKKKTKAKEKPKADVTGELMTQEEPGWLPPAKPVTVSLATSNQEIIDFGAELQKDEEVRVTKRMM